MRAADFEPDELQPPPVQVWPENLRATHLFLVMNTQWRVGAAGPTGLDYGVMPEVWQRLKVADDERDALFADLQVIERGALAAMHKKD